MKRFLIIAMCCLVAAAGFAAEAPKNIVLMIGDGMGMAQLTAGGVVKGALNIERLPVGGAVKTHSLNSFVTDSAAAATALATGRKTNNGMLSMDPDGKPIKTLFEYAAEKGMRRGVAVTCSVTHATPAAFSAHVKSRNMNDPIAEQTAAAKLEVLFGGGLAYFMPKSMEGSKRTDEKNLIDVLAGLGELVIKEQHFPGLADDKPASALIALQHPAPSGERSLSLGAMAAKALSVLSSGKNGFVLVVEGSQIDWAAHKNDEAGVIRETIEFDDAVGAVMDFAEKDKQTLVIVTADHETGGMALLDGSVVEKEVKTVKFASRDHSAAMVPLFAYGPGSAVFGGLKDNTFIGKQLIEYVK